MDISYACGGYEMKDIVITDSIIFLGVDDKTLDLFENQYKVPNGVSYNSYVILDEKVAVMDTVDTRATEAWFDNLDKAVRERKIDYLIVSHMEPDHAANIKAFLEKYPEAKVVSNQVTFKMIPQFFDIDLSERSVVVSEGDELNLGQHTLQFFMAPMVHWPEVMVTYEKKSKALFSADAFGKFGTLDVEDDWVTEARRYYFNIVGKYGNPVQALLKKAASVDIQMICPLHGPILKENLGFYIGKYDTWSKYEPEEQGIVIAYGSMHGNTARAAQNLAAMLKMNGVSNVTVYDLSRADMSTVLAEAFRYNKLVVACSTYDGGIFPCMEDFLHHLRSKSYQNRTVGIMENGSWAPVAAKRMKAILDEMKNLTILDEVVNIKSTLNEFSRKQMGELVEQLIKN